jgi:hypothetical protein
MIARVTSCAFKRKSSEETLAGLPDGIVSNQKSNFGSILEWSLNGKCCHLEYFTYCPLVYFMSIWYILWLFGILLTFLPRKIWQPWTGAFCCRGRKGVFDSITRTSNWKEKWRRKTEENELLLKGSFRNDVKIYPVSHCGKFVEFVQKPRVARFFWYLHDTQTGKNVPNELKKYQMVVKYPKCP